MRRGFSMVEIILAAAMFVIVAGAVMTTVLSGLNADRLAQEQSIAMQYATEGMEAVRSIRNQAYANLVNSAGTGILQISGVWGFSGSNNSTDSGKYTRTITVADVCRDGSGNIIACGSGQDANTKKVTSTVDWNFLAVRSLNVALTEYLTNWKAAISGSSGVLIYGDAGNVAQPRFRNYDNAGDSFGSESSTGTSFTDSVAGSTFEIKTSPNKQEAIAGYVNSSGVLRILCYDGSDWSSEWTVTVGGSGSDHRFAIDYEKTSGDAFIIYSTNTATSNEMAYRTKADANGCGSANWSSATNVTAARTNGVVQWIRSEMSLVSASNNIAIAWADDASDLSAMAWTGSSFGIAEPGAVLEADLERFLTSQDTLSFDLAIESLTGNIMVVWGPNGTTCTVGSNCIRYSRYTSSWSAVAAIPTVADRGSNVDVSANPNSNEIALGALDNSSSDLSTAYWSGSAWTGRANVDTSAETPDTVGQKLVACGWLKSGATTRYVVIYNDNIGSQISWYVGNGSAAPVVQTDFTTTPVLGDPNEWIEVIMDPKNPDRLMTSISDFNSDLFAKRLVMTSTPAFTWTNSDGSAALETVLPQANFSPFGFAYWRN